MPAAAAATVILVLISAATSPQWHSRKAILDAARNKAHFAPGPGRGAVGLVVFAIAAGIPVALGFVDGNALLLLGALAACMIGRAFASSRPSPADLIPALGWFVAVCWSVLASLLLSSRGLDLRQALAAQTVAGPALGDSRPAIAAVSAAALAAGLVGAVGWVSRLQPLVQHEEMAAVAALLRWGETALAASAVAASAWGPSLGALVFGPEQNTLARDAVVSFLLTCLAVAAVSFGRRFASRVARAPLLLITALASLGALGAALRLQ